MTVPLDRLYHYIESIARDIRGDDVIIYRFYPHGSKKLDDLLPLSQCDTVKMVTSPQIYCNDQEPLAHKYYQNSHKPSDVQRLILAQGMTYLDRNFNKGATIYDNNIVLHSEQRSPEIKKYEASGFLPVYYWCHAIIALDWFRYAKHDTFNKNVNKQFLIYNRAWAGTREYRLKFVDLLIKYNLVDQCQTSFNSIEPETNLHYTQHTYTREAWRPQLQLENYISAKQVKSSASADYDTTDYNSTDFEVVLETLFDDPRLHLTEKILRPIACGQPFLLAATHSSLAYIRSYGFKTFDSVIDETYDTIEDPVLRLEAIVKLMKTIADWSNDERNKNMVLINQIAAYNRKHFFSDEFFNCVVQELKNNLKVSLDTIEYADSCSRYITHRRVSSQYPEIKQAILNTYNGNRQSILKIIQEARRRYMRSLSSK